MDKKIEEMDIKVLVNGEEIYNDKEEIPYILAIGNKECGFSEDNKTCGGDIHVEFCGSLNNATALIPAIISMVIANSDMKQDKESIMKYLNTLYSLTLEYMNISKVIDLEDIKKGLMN